MLIDFGLAKKFAAGEPILGGASVTVMNGRAVGAGTPRYAAPEQFNGGDISPAADIHALGILANECFDGRPPRVWERIIGKATSSIPQMRYPDVDAFITAVRHRNLARLILKWIIAYLIVGLIFLTLIVAGVIIAIVS